MTDDAQRVAERMRAERAARDDLLKQRSDHHTVDTHELFEGNHPANWKSDAALWLSQNLPLVRLHALPDTSLTAWVEAMAHPDLKTMRVLSQALARALQRRRGQFLEQATQDLQRWVQRVDWYLVYAGDNDAARRVAGEAYDYWQMMTAADGVDAQHRALVEVFRVLHATPPSGAWLKSDRTARHALLRASALTEAAEILDRGGRRAGGLLRVPREVAVLDEEPRQPTHAELMDDDRPGIVRRAPTAGPSLVVVSSRDHLPEPPKYTARRDNAFSEIEAIAGRALPLVQPPRDLVEIREHLRREYPHAVAAIDAVLVPVAGQQWVKTPNVLFWGRAGTGKSELAQAIGHALGLGVDVYSCAGVHDASYVGTSRQWSTGRFSVSLQAIIRWQTANGVIILDEADKAGTGSHNGLLTSALLPFLESTTSRAIRDPYLEAKADLSALSYIATMNDLSGLSKPFLDRFVLVEVPEPTFEHLGDLAAGIVGRLRRERQTDERWVPALDPEEIGVLSNWWRGGSIRSLRRLVERLIDARALAPRH